MFFWKREFVCVIEREAKIKKGVVFWDPPDICVSSNVQLPLVYFLSMQTNPKIGLLQCSASGNDNSTCIKQLPLSQFYLLLLYFSINPLFIQTNACHITEWQYIPNIFYTNLMIWNIEHIRRCMKIYWRLITVHSLSNYSRFMIKTN